MIKSLFGPSSVPHVLREGLDQEMKIHRDIAARVATALTSSTSSEFRESLEKAAAGRQSSESDLQRDMATLADTQIRYEAEAKLLKAAYSGLRAAIR